MSRKVSCFCFVLTLLFSLVFGIASGQEWKGAEKVEKKGQVNCIPGFKRVHDQDILLQSCFLTGESKKQEFELKFLPDCQYKNIEKISNGRQTFDPVKMILSAGIKLDTESEYYVKGYLGKPLKDDTVFPDWLPVLYVFHFEKVEREGNRK